MMTPEQTAELCATYRTALAKGEDRGEVVGYLAAQYDVQRPAIWKALRRGGVLPPYNPSIRGGRGRPQGGGSPGYTEERRRRTKASLERREQFDNAPRVHRDPCPRCGARGDYGCGHSPIRLGTEFHV